MERTNLSIRRWSQRSFVIALALVGSLAVGVPRAGATVWQLDDLNSVARIDSQAPRGVFNWVVDGVDHMRQQWFWFRTGTMTREFSLDNLALSAEQRSLSRTHLELLYTSPAVVSAESFEILVKYDLTGGSLASHTADLAETIRIRNLGTTPLTLHFFSYSNFNLNNTAANDTVQQLNANTVRQSDPAFIIAETVGTPPPDSFEIATANTTLNSLNDASETTLNNNAGPVVGNGEWTWGWDFTIGVGGTAFISKDTVVRPVPQPLSLLLLGSGLVALALWGRRCLTRGAGTAGAFC